MVEYVPIPKSHDLRSPPNSLPWGIREMSIAEDQTDLLRFLSSIFDIHICPCLTYKSNIQICPVPHLFSPVIFCQALFQFFSSLALLSRMMSVSSHTWHGWCGKAYRTCPHCLYKRRGQAWTGVGLICTSQLSFSPCSWGTSVTPRKSSFPLFGDDI